MTEVLVTGATGAVGPALVRRLRQSGCKVRVYSRRPESDPWDTGVRAYRGHLLDAGALAPAVEGADTIFHLAALLHVENPPPSMRAEYERVNVEGTRRVVEAALASGVRRLVFFSTIAVYGPTGSKPADEERAIRPDSIYAETKARAEEIVLRAKLTTGQPLGTVLRPAAVYGPRMKGNYERLVNALARGRFLPIGRGDNRRTLVFDRDLADAALAVASSSAAAGRTYNVTDGTCHTMREIVVAISGALGRRPPPIFLPIAPVRVGVRAIEMASNLVGVPPPLRVATIDKYLEEVAVTGTRIADEVGWRPRVDLRTGWQEAIEVHRAGHLL